ncbi:MAG: hypothetical protein PHY73_00640 [Candidatus Omnitrophica bacterium]|nr:hypothetical protein [Candidatus Omnitrophota bacterium]
MNFKKNKKASSVVEYSVLILLFIGAMIAMRHQIHRSFFGRWKETADRFGYGQQYDPAKTLECQRYAAHDSSSGEWPWEIWYAQNCYACCIDKEGVSDCTEYGFNGSIQGVTADQCRKKPDEPQIPWGLSPHWCCATACETDECKD